VRSHVPTSGGPRPRQTGALFAYDAGAPLNLQKAVESTNNGVEVSAVSFGSPDGGPVTGLLFDPVGRSGLRPGIVLMHGMPGNARSMAGHAQQLARSGAVVIAIDAPFARRGGPPVRHSAEDRAEQVQLIKDLQRAVDVLRTRVNVDGERIAYVGVSYGGAMGALFVGVERRIRAAALVVGDGGLVSHFTGPEDSAFMASLSCATRRDWFQAMAPIEPVRFIPHASPTALLLQNGRSDNLVPRPMRGTCTRPRRTPRRSAGMTRDTGSTCRPRGTGMIGCTTRSVSTPGSSRAGRPGTRLADRGAVRQRPSTSATDVRWGAVRYRSRSAGGPASV
jgi:poly(3-hydroxybutyrate) depolymerase